VDDEEDDEIETELLKDGKLIIKKCKNEYESDKDCDNDNDNRDIVLVKPPNN